MKVCKKFGFAVFVFDGTSKAVDMFTRIHGAFGSRGYGLELPNVGESANFGVPGIGEVCVKNEGGYKCTVTFVCGPVTSWLKNFFARE